MSRRHLLNLSIITIALATIGCGGYEGYEDEDWLLDEELGSAGYASTDDDDPATCETPTTGGPIPLPSTSPSSGDTGGVTVDTSGGSLVGTNGIPSSQTSPAPAAVGLSRTRPVQLPRRAPVVVGEGKAFCLRCGMVK